MQSIVSFLSPEKIASAMELVQVSSEGLEMPDETAFACLYAARIVISRAYARDPEQSETVANFIEFASGQDWQTTRQVVANAGATPHGTARLLRMMANQTLSAFDQEPQGYPMAEMSKDEELVLSNEPQQVSESLYTLLRTNGMTPIGAASSIVNKAVRCAIADDASRWHVARLLSELLCDVLQPLDVGEPLASESSDAAED
jgi:hypothetical protein